MKKLLSLDDLYNFYVNQGKSCKFNAEHDDNTIVVHVDENMTFSNDYDPDALKLKTHLKACHLFENRNRSSISEKAMKEAIPSFYNAPILGYIHQLSDGSYDFAGHEMILLDNGEIEYKEIPIGVIPESCNAQLVYDEDADKTYLEVDGIIFREYTKAAEILERKGTSKVSVELSVDELSYSADTKILNIDKFHFSGITVLGCTDDENEKPISEGMEGSNITIASFSEENNSLFSHNDKLIETLDKLNNTLSKFTIDTTKEGGKETMLLEELLIKYGKTVEDITFEYEDLSDEELEAAFAEAFSENDNDSETPEDVVFEDDSEGDDSTTDEEGSSDDGDSPIESDETPDATESEPSEEEPTEEEPSTDEEFVDDDETSVPVVKKEVSFTVECNGNTKTFSVSLNDKLMAMHELVAETYSDLDGDYYDCVVFEDTKTVEMHGWFTGKSYRQNYKCKSDVFSLVGDRVEIFRKYMTQDEINAFERMKADFSAISEELQVYKDAESFADKMTVFDDVDYAQFSETDEFKALMSEENVKATSKEELETKAALAFAKLVKAQGTFAAKEQEVVEQPKKPSMFAFAHVETKSSFLDGLLGK